MNDLEEWALKRHMDNTAEACNRILARPMPYDPVKAIDEWMKGSDAFLVARHYYREQKFGRMAHANHRIACAQGRGYKQLSYDKP
jgi:hypothetical protein